MWAKLKQLSSFKAFTNIEDKQNARLLFFIIGALWVTYLTVMASALYWKDWGLIIILAGASIILIIPLGLLFRGQLSASSFITILSVLILCTLAATFGQGIHDIAIMSYPTIIIVSSLLLRRRGLMFFSILTIVALGWLVFGETGGWFVSVPYKIPTLIDFLVVVAILIVAVLSVDVLASHMRENLGQVQKELARSIHREGELHYVSTHDALTHVYNRAFFEQQIERLEHNQELLVSVIMADVDNLKIVNDTQGHPLGDELLRRASTMLRSSFRESDIIARIGGDEFSILLLNTNAAAAEQMIERFRTKLTENNTQYPDIPVNLSLGTATATTHKLLEAFKIADQRMYVDKASHKVKHPVGKSHP